MKYDHIVVQNPSLPATQLFLLYHAAGDNPIAMSEIGRWFSDAFPHALVVSIGAPEQDDEGGFHWFDPSAADPQRAITEAMEGFIASVRHWQKQSCVKADATALIGFSQGATMVLEAVKTQSDLAGRVVAFSGRYATLPQQAGTRTTIHLIHGDNDTVLPLTHALDAEERLTALGGTSHWILLTICPMPLMTVQCSLRSIACNLPYRAATLMKRLAAVNRAKRMLWH